MQLADLRRDYTFGALRRKDLNADPLQQFNNWFQQALAAGLVEVNAMTLSTVDHRGQPSSRVVLLKGVDGRGFLFFTNYLSVKSQELEKNPRAALCLYWPGLERQVCVRGECTKLPREESEAYFKSRPLPNQHGAWASRQSEVIPTREFLEKRFEEVAQQYPAEVPMPPYWGGYALRPSTIEFWQGGAGRLHDRFLYSLDGDQWKIERLSP